MDKNEYIKNIFNHELSLMKNKGYVKGQLVTINKDTLIQLSNFYQIESNELLNIIKECFK